MICEKLPETKKEIVEQLKKNEVVGLKDTVLFFSGIQEQGCWNEQKITAEWIKMIRPSMIEVLDGLK